MNFSNSKPLRWGIIGCGKVTEVKSGPAYQNTDGFIVTGVMRRDVEKARDYAERHGVEKVFVNADDLIGDNAIDAVYIATPPDTHKFYALKVAVAGKTCCVEKPMAPNYTDSLAIYEAFDQQKIPLFIAYYRRSLPRFLQIKQWLDEGKIGSVRHISWHLSKPPSDMDKSKKYNWRTDEKIAPGGYFDDLASHGLDLFTFLLGDIVEAKGIATNQLNLYGAKDAVTACWNHKSGSTGEGSWNFGAYEHNDYVEIMGSEGNINFSIFREKPLVLRNNSGKKTLEISNPKHIQQYHVQNMIQHLEGTRVHPSLGSSGLHTSWVMDKILGKL